MDVYVVLDGPILVGVSARLQGAEELRATWASDRSAERADQSDDDRGRALRESLRRVIYDRQQIRSTQLQHAE